MYLKNKTFFHLQTFSDLKGQNYDKKHGVKRTKSHHILFSKNFLTMGGDTPVTEPSVALMGLQKILSETLVKHIYFTSSQYLESDFYTFFGSGSSLIGKKCLAKIIIYMYLKL